MREHDGVGRLHRLQPLEEHAALHEPKSDHDAQELEVRVASARNGSQGHDCSVIVMEQLSPRCYRAWPSCVPTSTPIWAAQSGATSTIRGRLSEPRRMP